MSRKAGALQRLVLIAANRADLVLAVMLVAVIFMMILPLPTALVDVLVAINLAASAVLLMVSLYLPAPLAFSSFPSILLVTTLYRLALSVTTTRLILLQADAGHIVETFGRFVVGGNMVVGLVVFLILAVVQFIVITKGSERVAEVAARFSLDGMPGKQMSIDADLRAGSITVDEGKQRRAVLEKESQFYGAMDGAMKFVKGDAIAGLIIIVINLVGGMTIGTLQRNLPLSDAMFIYSTLTIGDGLVAQIPALLISITAGILITRVTRSDETATNVGTDIGNQILAQPRALLIASGFMALLALVPGMPTLVFLALGAITAAIGVAVRGDSPSGLTVSGTSRNETTFSRSTGDTPPLYPSVPLMLDLSASMESHFDGSALSPRLLEVRQSLYFSLGVPFPGAHLRFNPALPDHRYHVAINEIPFANGQILPGYLLVNEEPEHLATLGIPFELGEPLLSSRQSIWCPIAATSELNRYGITALNSVEVLAQHLHDVLSRHTDQFIGIQETRFLLTALSETFPDLVKEVQRILPIQRITEVLQRLVGEGVSIRNLRSICEALVDWGQKEKDSVLLTEHIRTCLKRQISHHFSGGQTALTAYMIGPELEETIRSAIRQTSSGSYLALDPQVSRRIIERVSETVGELSGKAPRPVILASMDIRRYVRRLIEPELNDLAVLSYQELVPELAVHPLEKIELA